MRFSQRRLQRCHVRQEGSLPASVSVTHILPLFSLFPGIVSDKWIFRAFDSQTQWRPCLEGPRNASQSGCVN